MNMNISTTSYLVSVLCEVKLIVAIVAHKSRSKGKSIGINDDPSKQHLFTR